MCSENDIWCAQFSISRVISAIELFMFILTGFEKQKLFHSRNCFTWNCNRMFRYWNRRIALYRWFCFRHEIYGISMQLAAINVQTNNRRKNKYLRTEYHRRRRTECLTSAVLVQTTKSSIRAANTVSLLCSRRLIRAMRNHHHRRRRPPPTEPKYYYVYFPFSWCSWGDYYFIICYNKMRRYIVFHITDWAATTTRLYDRSIEMTVIQ